MNKKKKKVRREHNNIEAEDVKEISHVVYKETGKASKVEVKDVKLNHPKEVQVCFNSYIHQIHVLS